eukprot:6009615-Prymnesium_polylepis.1
MSEVDRELMGLGVSRVCKGGWVGAKIENLSATPDNLGRMCDAGGGFGGYNARRSAPGAARCLRVSS